METRNEKVILIAEDEELNFRVMQLLLKRVDAKIIWAMNGKEALDIIMNNGHIDLILMDIRMPVMDGIEATREIKKIKKDLPIVAVTAHSILDAKEACFEAGCDEFLTKPVRPEILIGTVNKYLNAESNLVT